MTRLIRSSSVSRKLLLLATISALGGLAACGDKPEPESAAQQARSVTVVPVAERAISGAVTASGPLVPREEAAVNPEVTGYRVAEVLVEPGAYV
ncbi:MAG: efflux RND transporter periplasmic adaptor subunit, partial [Phenylobacterium sp.]|nr:efflux RND transporter periplasmic adaptor subunit [Phenylobacterium sp.]